MDAEDSNQAAAAELRTLLKGGGGSILVAAARPVIELLLALVLARILGSVGYGQFAYAIVVITLLSIPVQSGLPTLIVRETASNAAQTKWVDIKGLWTAATIIALGYCLLIIGGTLAVISLFTHFLGSAPDYALLWALALMPLLVLISVNGAKIRGLGKPVQGQLGEQVIRPLLFALIVTSFWQVEIGPIITPTLAMAMNIFAACLALFLTHLLVISSDFSKGPWQQAPTFKWRLWLSALLPLALIGGVQIISRQADLLILGILESDSSVGIYRVAAQLAMLALLVLQAIGYALSPYFSRLHVQGDINKLRQYAKHSAQITVLVSLSVLTIFWIIGDLILARAFGPEFEIGRNVLIILTFGHVVSCFFGPIGFLLTMTGHEREVFYVLGVSAIINIGLTFLLVPIVGMEGAALATVVTAVTWNVGFWRVAHKRLDVKCTALGI